MRGNELMIFPGIVALLWHLFIAFALLLVLHTCNNMRQWTRDISRYHCSTTAISILYQHHTCNYCWDIQINKVIFWAPTCLTQSSTTLSTKIARFKKLGLRTTRKHNHSVKISERLASVRLESFSTVHGCHIKVHANCGHAHRPSSLHCTAHVPYIASCLWKIEMILDLKNQSDHELCAAPAWFSCAGLGDLARTGLSLWTLRTWTDDIVGRISTLTH